MEKLGTGSHLACHIVVVGRTIRRTHGYGSIAAFKTPLQRLTGINLVKEFSCRKLGIYVHEASEQYWLSKMFRMTFQVEQSQSLLMNVFVDNVDITV
jgi:hypothetical protein